MAEVLGTVGSVITIGDLVIKIKHFGSKVRAAPDDWKRYYDKLEALNYVPKSLLANLLSSVDDPRDTTCPDGHNTKFLKCC